MLNAVFAEPYIGRVKFILSDVKYAEGAAPAGVGASQVDSCRRKRDMPDLRAVVLSRLRIHYR